MIVLDAILHNAVNPALLLLPRAMDSDAARVQLLATGGQESRYEWRYQKIRGDPYAKGPARSFWQIERPTVVLLMTNSATRDHVVKLCAARKASLDPILIHAKIETDDVLAAGLARLLYWADAKPLPPAHCDHETGWKYYLRVWRPGKPHREFWDTWHAAAQAQVIS